MTRQGYRTQASRASLRVFSGPVLNEMIRPRRQNCRVIGFAENRKGTAIVRDEFMEHVA